MIKVVHATSFTTSKFSCQHDLWLNEGNLFQNVGSILFGNGNCLIGKCDHLVENVFTSKNLKFWNVKNF
jgi:hypothetical protein